MNGLIGYLLSKKYVDSKEAPKDGKQYGRQDGDWTEVTGGGGSGAGTFLIKVTKSREVFRSDKTFAEIESAIENGLTPIVHYALSGDDYYYYLSDYSPDHYAVFNNISDVEDGFFIIQAITIRQNSSGVTSVEWHEYEYSF